MSAATVAADDLRFRGAPGLTFGIELELQILDSRTFNLVRGADDLIRMLERHPHPGEVKPEITESMIEINTTVQRSHEGALLELRQIRDALVRAADRLNLRVSGGGSHPFHKWSRQRIYPTERFRQLLERYGYLARQFTIFGQHVHLGCPDGDAAMYLTHALGRYVPHFIALSASSPFQQGQDTQFQSSRLNAVSAFPLSGHAPPVRTWRGFEDYFARMRRYGIVESMKDFYWDIRPKPEYGTVEIRVFDTPLGVEHAVRLATYARLLARQLLAERPAEDAEGLYLVYQYNRFQACRHGFAADCIDSRTETHVPLREDILATLRGIAPYAEDAAERAALAELERQAAAEEGDARRLRERYREHGTLNDVVRLGSLEWSGGKMD
jgi:carboxylate-amine ligase